MKNRKNRGSLARFLRRFALLAVTLAVLTVFGAYTLLGTAFHGPSPIARDNLTRNLMADDATDWIPGLYLEDSLIAEICGKEAP